MTPLPVILDTDPGVDDALALLLAGASSELEVLAVHTVGGNVSLDLATENARRIVPMAWPDRPNPPIHRGFASGRETAEFVHGWDGLGGVVSHTTEDGQPLYPPHAQLSPVDAVTSLLNHTRQRPGEITLITLGPLTNLSLAFQEDPVTFRQLRRIVIMGGAFRETGNASPVAEFNIFADPEAAQQVCESGVPQLWVPLDVTHQCLLRPADVEGLQSSEAARFVHAITHFYMEHHLQGFGERACILHDPLPVGLVLWPDLLLRKVARRVDVETEGVLTRGVTVADFRPGAHSEAREPNAEICLEVDAEGFGRRFVERLARLCRQDESHS